ncbi:MAG: hypothetical protein M3R08_11095, partial [Bacteroidota bacterium]|nr:hypothetical protein [Bacteroidota bacterium]
MIRSPLLLALLLIVQLACIAQWSPLQVIDPPGHEQRQVVTGDLDNDGDLDVVSQFHSVGPSQDSLMIHIYDHLTDEFSSSSYEGPPAFSDSPLDLIDLNGDAYLDI